MGCIVEVSGNNLIIANSRTVLVVNIRNNKVHRVTLPTKTKVDMKNQEINKRVTSSMSVSPNEKYLAVATSEKQLIIWNMENWNIEKNEMLVKRPIAHTFSYDSSIVLLADKNGDVYSFCVSDSAHQQDKLLGSKKQLLQIEEGYPRDDEETGSEPLLGHLSMLLDIIVSRNGKFIITCDRDEKIRVSCYPNCYNIHKYCLGHEEFVSCLKLLPDTDDFLLSGSGDGTVRLWNFIEGSCLQILDTGPEVEKFHGRRVTSEKKKEETVFDNDSLAAVIKLDARPLNEEKEYILVISLHRLPILLIYILKKNREFIHLSSFELASPPVDFTFLPDGEVFVVQDSRQLSLTNPIMILSVSTDTENPIKALNCHNLLNLGETYRDCFRNSEDSLCHLDVDALYKQHYDNISDYKKRKEAKLSCHPAVAKKIKSN